MKPMSIVPVRHLDLIKDDECFMALLHLVQASRSYCNFFRARSEEGKFVLLDDSAIEKPGFANVSSILQGAIAIKASEVMLADVIRDKNATLNASNEMLQEIISRFSYDWPFRIMAVPQGKNWVEWLECASIMAKWPEVDTLGISYTTTDYFGTRAWAIDGLHLLGLPKKTIHLLGCFDVEEAKMTAKRYPGIRSIDSAIATIFTQHSALLGNGWKRSHDLQARIIDFEKCNLPGNILADNLRFWRRQILETETYMTEDRNGYITKGGSLRYLPT